MDHLDALHCPHCGCGNTTPVLRPGPCRWIAVVFLSFAGMTAAMGMLPRVLSAGWDQYVSSRALESIILAATGCLWLIFGPRARRCRRCGADWIAP